VSILVALRKALADDREKAPCIENIPGRGYRFAKSVSREEIEEGPERIVQHLPSGRIVGREGAIVEVTNRAAGKAVCHHCGPRGIGKTTVALGVTHVLSQIHGDSVHFIDLGMIDDPCPHRLRPFAFATGIVGRSGNPKSKIKSRLRDKKAVVVFDCCEHVV